MQQAPNPDKLPTIEFDYTFGSERANDEEHKVTILVAVDDIYGLFAAIPVRKKGPRDEYVARALVNHIERLGFVRADMKRDQEPSTLDVAKAVVSRCSSTSLMIVSTPKGSKGSLGKAERANGTVQGQIRALRAGVNEYYGIDLKADHILVPWMVRRAAWILNRFLIRASGKTPYRALRGKNYDQPIAAFGECVMYRDTDADATKLKPRWKGGIFVGKLDLTEEFAVLTESGAPKVRTIKRMPRPQDECRVLLSKVVGQPWNPTGRPELVTTPSSEIPATRTKRIYLRQHILDRYGRTDGCAGCRGLGPHTQECRRRIEGEMIKAGEAIQIGEEIAAKEKREG